MCASPTFYAWKATRCGTLFTRNMAYCRFPAHVALRLAVRPRATVAYDETVAVGTMRKVVER